MSQNGFVLDGTETGDDLKDALDDFRDDLYSSNSGASAPSYVVLGLLWLDTSTTPKTLKVYDGASSVIIGYLDTTAHTFSPVPLGQVGTKTVDETDIADGKRLQYDSGSGGVIYVAAT
jgi:hypothetical protein